MNFAATAAVLQRSASLSSTLERKRASTHTGRHRQLPRRAAIKMKKSLFQKLLLCPTFYDSAVNKAVKSSLLAAAAAAAPSEYCAFEAATTNLLLRSPLYHRLQHTPAETAISLRLLKLEVGKHELARAATAVRSS